MALDINWGLLQPVDVGGNFQRGFEMGQQRIQKQQMKSALAAYSQDPTNPEAQNALASVSPEYAMQLGQYRMEAPQREAAQQEKISERQRQNLIMGGKILRQIKPTDQASYDQARQMAAQVGVDISGVPEQFDPQYVSQIVQTADALDPPKSGEMPGIAKEVDYYRSIGRHDLAEQRMESHAAGSPLIMDMGDGRKAVYPRGGLGGGAPGPAPGAIEDGFRFKGGNPADRSSWEPVNGGPTPQASGTFRP